MTRWGFVGRERELGELVALSEEAVLGRGGIALVSGEPGIGKTRLATELIASTGGRVLPIWGHSWEGGGTPPFWPWIDAFRSCSRHVDPAPLARRLGSDGALLAHLVPALADPSAPPRAAPPALQSAEARFRLFDTVTAFVSLLSEEQPLLILLEDVHAADVPSLFLLEHLARSLPALAVLVVVTYREHELRADAERAAVVGRVAQHATVIPLTGLDPPAVRAMLEEATGAAPPPGLAPSFAEVTGGNPLFVGELIRIVAGRAVLPERVDLHQLGLPLSVRETLRRRVEALPGEAQELLVLAAALGREFDLAPLERASGAPDVLDLLGQALDAGLVVEEDRPGRFAFIHDLVRHVLYDALGVRARREIHATLGRALQAVYGDEGHHVVELSRHFFQSLPGPHAREALRYAMEAGGRAMRELAYEEAVVHFSRAWEVAQLPEVADTALRCDICLALGQAQAAVGRLELIRGIFTRAVELARASGDARRFAHAAFGFLATFAQGYEPEVIGVLQEALAQLGDDEPALRVRLLAALASRVLMEEPERADALSQEALALARRLGEDGALAEALNTRADVLVGAQHATERLALLAESLPIAQRSGGRLSEFWARIHLSFAQLELGDWASGEAGMRGAARLMEQLRLPIFAYTATGIRLVARLREGRLREGRVLAAEVLAIGSQVGDQIPCRFAVLAMLMADLLEQDAPALRADLEALEEQTKLPPLRPFAEPLVAVVTGNHAHATRLLAALAERGFVDVPVDHARDLRLALLADACARAGDSAIAATLTAQLRPASGRYVCTLGLLYAPVDRLLGALAALTGDDAEAEERFEAALALAQRMQSPPALAQVQLDYARMLLRRRDPGDAERALDLLREAEGIGRALGVRALEKEATRLLGSRAQPAPRADGGRAAQRLFRREGDAWHVVFDGETFRVRDSKGMRHLAQLLANPAQEIHVLDLVADAAVAVEGKRVRGGDLVDAPARAAYRRRLDELRGERAEAERMHDVGWVARIDEEASFVEAELRRAYGLGERTRHEYTPAERARLSVTKTIKVAVERLAEHSPALAEHLRATVHTGMLCSYRPDPQAAVAWRT